MIVVKELIKQFNEKTVIDNISFHISKGEATGIIGLNGAGKTTMIKLLTGSLLPDSGLVRVNGINPYRSRKENLRQIGYVSGLQTQLWEEMPLKHSFEYSRHMYKIPHNSYVENMNMIKEFLEIDKLTNTVVRNLSLGQRVCADIAYTLLHNPEVIFLDEPTIGLDVVVKDKILKLIKQIVKIKETTIVYTSHNLKELELLCKRVIVIDKGRKIFEGDLERFKKEHSVEYILELTLEAEKFPDLQDLPLYKYIIAEDKLLIYFDKKIINTSTIVNHVIRQCKIKQIKIHEPTLESVIREMYERRE